MCTMDPYLLPKRGDSVIVSKWLNSLPEDGRIMYEEWVRDGNVVIFIVRGKSFAVGSASHYESAITGLIQAWAAVTAQDGAEKAYIIIPINKDYATEVELRPGDKAALEKAMDLLEKSEVLKGGGD